jgi:hypothetical protein
VLQTKPKCARRHGENCLSNTKLIMSILLKVYSLVGEFTLQNLVVDVLKKMPIIQIYLKNINYPTYFYLEDPSLLCLCLELACSGPKDDCPLNDGKFNCLNC